MVMGTYTPSKIQLHTAQCPACGSDRLSERENIEYFEYGSGSESVTLNAVVPMCLCADCGMQFTDERGERARHTSVCAHLKISDPEKIVAIRERNNMSQTEFATVSRIGRASLARWESGAIYQNGSSDSLIYLLGFPENVARLKSRFDTNRPDEFRASPGEKPRFRCLTEAQIISMKISCATFELHPEH